MSNLIHLHVHDEFSLLDGYGSPLRHAMRAKELGMNALASTNHNILGGCVNFQKACKEVGIKPLLGVELYYTLDTNILSKPVEERNDMALASAEKAGISIPPKATKKLIKELVADHLYDTRGYHILFIAKDQTGWNNLVKLQSEAAHKCTYNGRFHCDDEMISKYKDGLIMTTACLGSRVNHYIMDGKIDKAYELLSKWHSLFQDNFFIEIQPLNEPDQALCNHFLINFALNNGVKLIGTNDVHYTNESDIDDHDTLLCIGIGKDKDDETRMRYAPEFWIKSYDEMIHSFSKQYRDSEFLQERYTFQKFISIIMEALDNTNLVADMVSEDIRLGSKTPILPKLDIPNGFTSEQYLTLESYKGLFLYLSKNKDLDVNEYIKRLDFELNVINSKGFADYMLIVKDIIKWCEDNNIPTGPGRGSAAGSLVLFVNRITKCIDPIKYGLLFSRFLTMDRKDLPDIDSDFSYVNRQRVIEYLKNKYGADCVSSIGTYSELGIKSGLKDVGRVLKIDFGVMNNITKKMDDITEKEPGFSFADIDELKDGNENEKNRYIEYKVMEEEYPELFRLARTFEGTPRNQGVHASGVLVTPFPISDMFPTRVLDDGTLVTMYTGPQVEACNGVKLDILGLKTLDVLDLTVKSVDPNSNIYELYDKVDNFLSDEGMFNMLNRKESEGIFQLESSLFKGLISDIPQDNIEDITVLTSLGRPGPLSAGLHHNFARRKKGEEEIKEPLPGTMHIVNDSKGVLVYQEHTMRIAQVVAGFNDSQADSFLRKAQAKKKKDLMALCDQWFIYGKLNETAPEGYDSENKKQVFYDPDAKYGDPIKGGIANGYNEDELIKYCDMIKDFCSYLFNKSHASCYSFLSCCTLYCKQYHTTEFLAGLLSLQTKQEKIDLYCKVANSYGIGMTVPDLNLSGRNFTPMKGKILYGIGSIKGVGDAAIPAIINNRPYASLEEAYNNAVNENGKKMFNKKVGEALIKAGALTFLKENRYELLNDFQTVRKAKKEDPLDINEYNDKVCIELERETLGSPITCKPLWDTVLVGESVTVDLVLKNVREKTDKNGRIMAFIKAGIDDVDVEGIVFSTTYAKNKADFDMLLTNSTKAKVKKDDKGKFIVESVVKEKNTTSKSIMQKQQEHTMELFKALPEIFG